MPAFQAINLEPEENVDDQVDTTKELHVDEALKRFQTALKLHAQGVPSREAAAAAYEELFESEIFQYREALTEYERAERQADGRPEVSSLESLTVGLDVDAGGADGVAASLAQALYLSYKNFGQFSLDRLKDAGRSDPTWKTKSHIDYHADGGSKILDSWVAALDQDPSDPELWRKLSRFAASMNSGRLKRYCLESAIELDDDPAVMEVDPPSLAEGLAGEQLKEQLHVLDDEIALSHPIMAPWLKREMPALIKRHLDPIPFLPDPTLSLTPPPSNKTPEQKLLQDKPDDDTEIAPAITTWSRLGLELMKCLEDTAKAIQICDAVLRSTKDTSVEMEGVDGGKPQHDSKEELAEKQIKEASESQSRDSKDREVENENAKSAEPQRNERSVSVSNRKRSQSAAGLPDGAEEEAAAEKRSKRIRRRDTAQAEELTDPSAQVANQLLPYQEADQHLFQMTKNILENLGVEDQSVLGCLGELLESCSTEDRVSKLSGLAAKDLHSVITTFRDDAARVLLDKKEKATLGLTSFLEHTKGGSQEQVATIPFDETQGLRAFAEKVMSCREWILSGDIVFEWVKEMSKSYASAKWSDEMKVTVVQMLNRADADIYERISAEVDANYASVERLSNFESIIMMVFELHVDIYERITNPSSAVDYATRMETKYRLERWLDIASAYLRLLAPPLNHPICARFLWASVMASAMADNPVREHILLMWTSLRDLLVDEKVETISLPNNIVMPLVSSAAADREISKLTTMDFFLSLFQEEMESPAQVIETLEPVLNPSTVFIPDEPEDDDASSKSSNMKPITECAGQGLRDLWKFLLNSSTELRLFLWSRLGDAYEAIGYTTKKFSCHLKGIEMIMADLEGERYAKTPDESRRLLFMRALKSLDELVIQALSLALNDSSAFDIFDEQHIQSSSSAVAKAACLLHVAALRDDEVRIGVSASASNSATFNSLMNRLREMQVRTWCLQYTLFKAGVPQQSSILEPENELASYLAAVHLAIGLRKYCKSSNKIFLKMMRAELLKLENVENWEDYLGQVLYDLHGLKLGVGIWEVQDHGCPHENLERRQTMQLVEKVMVLANRMPMKDLLKSDLKTTIDHMQQTIGQPKSTTQMIYNLRNFTESLKKPIHPLRLFQALVGAVAVDAVTVNTPEADLAKHGWFFLLGMIALTKFKGVDLNRRQTPGATDDLRVGASFLRLQLQFTAGDWHSWFRLAECFDYELDEAVLWTADKMNKDRADLVKFQRSAIHCYTLALSHSRHAEVDTNDGDPLHDLYHKFGMRLYASSREPFAMEPFQHSDQERFFIEHMGNGTFKKILHEQMSEYKVWKFAAKLFKMAMERQPKNWKNHYMLAKCFWKMHRTPIEKLDKKDARSRVSAETVLDMLKEAVSVAYNARKSRNSEPILEPHYKIVSVLHKMVMAGDLPSADAATILAKQPFGIMVNADDHFASFSEPEDWEEYVIRNLSKLKEKDKSNWQHRIIMRHARILFDDDGVSRESTDVLAGAKAAFNILRENMFTKTMVMNVWKCDAERPGRHHVYTEQYVRFMTKLLVLMEDQVNLELLLRRLRKKGADFYHFQDMWQSCCLAYLKLLRQVHKIPPTGVEDVFKALSSEEFEIMSERITEWAAKEGSQVPAFICMKDAIELKKLNASLMKAVAIDELVNDCYAKIYLDVADALPGLKPKQVIEERNQAKEVAAKLEAEALAEAQADAKANSLNSLLNPSGDAAEAATPQDAEKAEAAPRARKMVVRRPDVIRKAEQAVVRALEAPRSAKSRVGSMSSKRGSQTPNIAASDASDSEGPDAQVRREAAEVDVEMRDAGAHDEAIDDSKMGKYDESEVRSQQSADDESDLSDVPDDYDEVTPPGLLMFPNLVRGQAEDGETSGEDADSESEGDEPDETIGEEDTMHEEGDTVLEGHTIDEDEGHSVDEDEGHTIDEGHTADEDGHSVDEDEGEGHTIDEDEAEVDDDVEDVTAETGFDEDAGDVDTEMDGEERAEEPEEQDEEEGDEEDEGEEEGEEEDEGENSEEAEEDDEEEGDEDTRMDEAATDQEEQD
ncbi:hypothetical protein B0I35DRAFT_514612 [Stachybotrys elegans]|uniref:Histone transcription regulator 3 homolog n=1 Tax=Stachybotrys elegans TaxID=80388 RepID=A0A8K0SNB7_9HYPO|nr:hypothetical protein B0I35DRAFT_514612 [Stachybotrys elegans]